MSEPTPQSGKSNRVPPGPGPTPAPAPSAGRWIFLFVVLSGLAVLEYSMAKRSHEAELSYTELYRDGHACERWNMLHPAETPRVPFVSQCLKDAPGVFVAASDNCRVLPDSIDRWMPRKIRSLGTDGFGRSEDRAALRDFFEVDARFVAIATLAELLKEGQIDGSVVQTAIADLGINPDKPNPAKA